MPVNKERKWNLAKVVDNADPAKRRRLKLRFPNMSEDDIDDDHLQWTLPEQGKSEDFDLPDIGDTVLCLTTDDYERWLYLPDKASWQDFSDDDYATAMLRKHKDVMSVKYEESNGWTIELLKDIKFNTDKTETVITGDNAKFVYDKVEVVTDGASVTVKVNNCEFSTDGSTFSIKNGSCNMKDLLDALHQALLAHTHPTAMGPSGPPINAADFSQSMTKFDQLYK